jgi:hypothetical protein
MMSASAKGWSRPHAAENRPSGHPVVARRRACWVQIRDAPIDLRLLGKRRRGGTKGRRPDETSILPSHRWSYPTHWRRVKLLVRGLNE